MGNDDHDDFWTMHRTWQAHDIKPDLLVRYDGSDECWVAAYTDAWGNFVVSADGATPSVALSALIEKVRA